MDLFLFSLLFFAVVVSSASSPIPAWLSDSAVPSHSLRLSFLFFFTFVWQDHLKENEVVYVATDETDLSAFEPFKKYIRVKFLADYYDRAGVSEMNPNLIGMLDQVRCCCPHRHCCCCCCCCQCCCSRRGMCDCLPWFDPSRHFLISDDA